MTTLEVLKAARELISDPKRWTQSGYAVEFANGGGVFSPWSVGLLSKRKPIRWCAMGAIGRQGAPTDPSILGAIDTLKDIVSPSGLIGCFNDTHTHAEVLDAFDRAIASLEAKP